MTVAALAAVSGGGAGRDLLGAVIAGCSAVLYDAGYILEKQALIELPDVGLHPLHLLRTAGASPRWLVGFAAMLVGLALQVAALTLAPVSVVQPILAGGLIALAAVGSLILGERLSGRHKTVLVLVLLAVAATAASAAGSDPVARVVPPARLAAMSAVVIALAALAARAGLAGTGARRTGGGRGGATPAGFAGIAGVAVGAGLLYGLGAVAEKAVATRLVSHGLVAGAGLSLLTAYPWLFVATTLAGMVLFQVGLQAYPASLMASLTNVVSTACALAGASFVFGEALLPTGWWSVPRVAGLLAVLLAVALLAGDAPGAADPSRPDHAVAP